MTPYHTLSLPAPWMWGKLWHWGPLIWFLWSQSLWLPGVTDFLSLTFHICKMGKPCQPFGFGRYDEIRWGLAPSSAQS